MGQIQDAINLKLGEEEWFEYLDHSMKDLVWVSVSLIKREEEEKETKYHDYSFLVFPMAKAYEGFLKKVFLDMGLINSIQFEGKRFRVGKSLNPDLPEKYRDEEWLFGQLDEVCARMGEENLANRMWDVWRESRNLLFHYWPAHTNFVSLEEAKTRVMEVIGIMREVVESKLVNVG